MSGGGYWELDARRETGGRGEVGQEGRVRTVRKPWEVGESVVFRERGRTIVRDLW